MTIGLPVIARIDSAAPPRASPSTRVNTMPVMPARSPKAFATLTASWPVIASATRRVWCGVAASRTAAEHLDEVVVHDLDDHLPRGNRAQHLLSERPLAHRVDEIAHDRERDIGLQQRDADFAQGRRDIVLAQRAAAAQAVEDLVEPVAQTIEHRTASPQHRWAGARNSRTGRLPKKWGWGGGLTLLPKGARTLQAGRIPVNHGPCQSAAAAGGALV